MSFRPSGFGVLVALLVVVLAGGWITTGAVFVQHSSAETALLAWLTAGFVLGLGLISTVGLYRFTALRGW